jgi:hypothetical protein
MARKTQGTILYTIDPDTDEVLVVGCATGITGIDTSLDQLETTCLEDDARTYEPGLATPGAASFDINFDPSDNSHVRLHQLKVAGAVLQWAVGFGRRKTDPTTFTPPAPTVDSEGNFELPNTRDWISFQGYMSSYPFDAALNSFWKSTVGIQVSGEPSVVPRTEAPSSGP